MPRKGKRKIVNTLSSETQGQGGVASHLCLLEVQSDRASDSSIAPWPCDHRLVLSLWAPVAYLENKEIGLTHLQGLC
jgi:hypothetical protein